MHYLTADATSPNHSFVGRVAALVVVLLLTPVSLAATAAMAQTATEFPGLDAGSASTTEQGRR